MLILFSLLMASHATPLYFTTPYILRLYTEIFEHLGEIRDTIYGTPSAGNDSHTFTLLALRLPLRYFAAFTPR